MVIKPAVSASAYETHLVDGAHAPEVLERLLAQGDVVVQEFVPEVTSAGEWSLIYFDRVFSHAVKKAPKLGDFRVQEEHGGTFERGDPPAQAVLVAESALRAVDDDLLYARVDVVEREAGPLLMELELIEPSLFFRADPLAPARFAVAVKEWLTA
jgi:glutathione synthase/RimK-type ligase-like ATP-grasp enzyme